MATEDGNMKRTHHSGRTDGEMLKYAPKRLTREEFGRRLYQAIIARGWTQSELARKADLRRDMISRYVRGESLPSEDLLHKIAAALGVKSDDLLPNHVANAVANDTPDFEIKRSPGMPANMTWLRIDRAVSFKTAVAIAELIENDSLTDTGRSSGPSAVLGSED